MRVKGKMAAVSATVTLLLLCGCLVASTDTQDACDDYAATNGNFTVRLNLKLKLNGFETLRWLRNNDTILNRKRKTFITGSKEDVDEEGSLKLKNLQHSDAGRYTPGVWTGEGKSVEGLKSTRLCVLDPVQEPSVTTECSKTSVRFTCNVAQGKGLTFEWLRNNKVLASEKGRTVTLVANQVESEGFSCRVSNRISSRMSAAVKQTCFQSKLFGINTWIVVGIGGGVVLVLIIVVIVCCIRARRKKHVQMKEEDELRLTWTNPSQEQGHNRNHHHHHHHHHQHNHPPNQNHHRKQQQQQAPGHTGPRQHRSKHHRDCQLPRAPEQPGAHPQPSPRRPAQGPEPSVDDERPPPLPQPRKKAPKTRA